MDQLITGPFVKSSLSGNSDNCVEVASVKGGGRAVRDSKDQAGPVLIFAPAAWEAFIAGVKDGQLS